MSEQKNGLDLSSVMNMLSQNPDLIGNLMSAIAPKSEPPKVEGSEEKEEEKKDDPITLPSSDAITALAPLLLSAGGGKSSKDSKNQNPRCELLRALRPFLSKERCDAIDYMIKMDGLSGILRGINR